MKRRQFVAGLTYFIGSLGIPRQSYAQAPAFLRIGSASPTPRGDPASFLIPFEQRMAELGYIEDKNFALEFITVSQPTARPAAPLPHRSGS
jgi:hypothetical protein